MRIFRKFRIPPPRKMHFRGPVGRFFARTGKIFLLTFFDHCAAPVARFSRPGPHASCIFCQRRKERLFPFLIYAIMDAETRRSQSGGNAMQEGRFVLKSPFKPQGDQPQAIEALAAGVQSGMP